MVDQRRVSNNGIVITAALPRRFTSLPTPFFLLKNGSLIVSGITTPDSQHRQVGPVLLVLPVGTANEY